MRGRNVVMHVRCYEVSLATHRRKIGVVQAMGDIIYDLRQ
eukprot:SAG31_NODE_10922_length_1083_cov_1.200203_2_plen_39_part_01